MIKRHIFFWGALLVLLSVTPVWVMAQKTSMTLTPVWRPGEQLTTLTADSDFRYVDVQLQVTGNVQFWAVNIGCALSPDVLTNYVYDEIGSPPDTGDDVPMVTWGPDWGTNGTDFVPVSSVPGQGFDYDSVSGTISLRATRLGAVPSIGVNGAEYTLLLASLRLRVRDLGSVFTTRSASIKCNPIEFLDRDGRSVVKAKQAKTPDLIVRTGYTINGTALLQSANSHGGTVVTCTNLESSTPYVTGTDGNGNFSFGGSSQLIREFGAYSCVFNNPVSKFLDTEVNLALNTPTFYLLPTILKTGNVATGAGSVNDIDDADVALFTSSWVPGAVGSPYSGLDVNGDSIVNEADLAIMAGNYNPSDRPYMDGSHVLYGLATDYGGDFPNSRAYWGDPFAGAVQLYENPKSDRIFWPNMSPDGNNVVYSRLINKTGQYVLYISPTAKPKGRQITPKKGYDDDALAPAWSPDGQRIAFICSWEDQSSGYQFDEGDLCIIDATGSHLQKIATQTKVYPPAWFDNNVIVYAGTSDHPIAGCRNNLCFIDLVTNASGAVGSLLGDGDDVADMPAFGVFQEGATKTSVLFYRFDNGTTNSVVARTLAYSSGSFTPGSALTVATPSGGNDIAYYNASPMLDVMYYESTVSNNIFRTIDIFFNVDFIDNGVAGLSVADWDDEVSQHAVDGFVGNPVTVSAGGLVGQPWNGSVGGTLFHAQRATFDWVP